MRSRTSRVASARPRPRSILRTCAPRPAAPRCCGTSTRRARRPTPCAGSRTRTGVGARSCSPASASCPELILATRLSGPRPAAGGFLVPQLRRAAERAQAHPTERLLKMSRSLRERLRGAVPRLPARHLAAVGERAARGGRGRSCRCCRRRCRCACCEQLQEFIAREGWTDLLLLPFFSMVDRRRSLHLELIASTRAQFPAMLATEVPYWSEIERMSVRRDAAAGECAEAARRRHCTCGCGARSAHAPAAAACSHCRRCSADRLPFRRLCEVPCISLCQQVSRPCVVVGLIPVNSAAPDTLSRGPAASAASVIGDARGGRTESR